MSADPIERIAKLRIIKASAELEVQISQRVGSAPALEILRRLRDRAAESLVALATCNTEDPKEIRLLQNEVKRYDEWVGWLREIISEGVAYDAEFTAADREEMLDLLTQSPEGEQEAIALGLVDQVPRDA